MNEERRSFLAQKGCRSNERLFLFFQKERKERERGSERNQSWTEWKTKTAELRRNVSCNRLKLEFKHKLKGCE